MGFAIGGITQPMCELLDEGLVKCVVDAQAFDQASIESIKNNPRHFEISTSEYANPMNKGAYVNKLDFVILGALEVDVDFNCNVVVGSDGIVRGCSGRPSGHCGRFQVFYYCSSAGKRENPHDLHPLYLSYYCRRGYRHCSDRLWYCH